MGPKLLLLLAAVTLLAVGANGRALKTGGRKYEGRVCQWKADVEIEVIKIVDLFDCGVDIVIELNAWVVEKGRIKKGDLCSLPCDAEYKPKKDRKKWHHHGEICQFKADRDYKRDDFCGVFNIEWIVILEINEDWCGDVDVEVTVIKKGQLWDVPCHHKHKHLDSDWHWKPQPKRKWKGDACKWKADRDEHPRRLAKRFDLDWDLCLEVNPWWVSRKRCGKDEIVWIPCDCRHEERGHTWHIEPKRYTCDFEAPEPPRRPEGCSGFCPGEWNWCPRPEWEWFDRRCDPRPEWRPPVVPDWMCMPREKPSWYSGDRSFGAPREGGVFEQGREEIYGVPSFRDGQGHGSDGQGQGPDGFGQGPDGFGQGPDGFGDRKDGESQDPQFPEGTLPTDGAPSNSTSNGGSVGPTDPTTTDATSTDPTTTTTDCAVPPCDGPQPTGTDSDPTSTPSEPTTEEPSSTEPTSTEPSSTEPTSTEPTSTEPTSTEPSSTEPTSTEPSSSTSDPGVPADVPSDPVPVETYVAPVVDCAVTPDACGCPDQPPCA